MIINKNPPYFGQWCYLLMYRIQDPWSITSSSSVCCIQMQGVFFQNCWDDNLKLWFSRGMPTCQTVFTSCIRGIPVLDIWLTRNEDTEQTFVLWDLPELDSLGRFFLLLWISSRLPMLSRGLGWIRNSSPPCICHHISYQSTHARAIQPTVTGVIKFEKQSEKSIHNSRRGGFDITTLQRATTNTCMSSPFSSP